MKEEIFDAHNKKGIRIYDMVQEIEYLDEDGCATYISRIESCKTIEWNDGYNKARYLKNEHKWILEEGDVNIIQRLEKKYQALLA